VASTLQAKIAARDLREFRKDLESVALGLGRELTAALKDNARPIIPAAKPLAPFDPDHRTDRDDKLGHIRESMFVVSLGAGAAIASKHPAAVVHEYGGTIAPQGTPITIDRGAFAHTAGERLLPQIERDLQRRIDTLVGRHFPTT